INDVIKKNAEEVLTPFYKNLYTQLLPKINEIKYECQSYRTAAIKKGIREIEIVPSKGKDTIHKKIIFHHAYFELKHNFLKFGTERKKYNTFIKDEMNLLLDTLNKMFRKMEQSTVSITQGSDMLNRSKLKQAAVLHIQTSSNQLSFFKEAKKEKPSQSDLGVEGFVAKSFEF
ncbi:hypothetical protein, partial [Legionella sainthelensi]|uniref:hypothetical protein n=1 Tax=Legionella sainthelensi TaxID=28087 RepID=UPI0013595839